MIAIGVVSVVEMRLAGRLIDQGDGTVTVANVDGTVVSVQPDGRIETRPAGTAGAYERATLVGQMLFFCPDAASGKVFAIPFAAKVPA